MLRRVLFGLVKILAYSAPLTLLHKIAEFLTWIVYWVDRTRVPALIANMQHLGGPGTTRKRAKRMALQSYRHMGYYLIEFFSTPRRKPHFLAERVRITGQENLNAAYREGKGVLLLSMHYSNWELSAALAAYLGYRIIGISDVHPDPPTNEMFMEPRRHVAFGIVDVATSVRKTYKLLREGAVVAIMADRDTTNSGIEVDYFGKPVKFPKGPARMSIGSGAPAVMMCIRRRADKSYDMVFHPAIYPPKEGDRDARVQELTQQYARLCEEEIRKDPTQYTVFYPIWEGSGVPVSA